MSGEFIRLTDIDGQHIYVRKSAIKAVYAYGESSTVIDMFDNGSFYVKGEVDHVAQLFLDRQDFVIYS